MRAASWSSVQDSLAGCVPAGACRLRRVLAILVAASLVASLALAQPQTEVHGSLDAFAAPGATLAWGVLRGKDEAATEVVVRVEADPARFGSLAVTGVDPFTRRAEPLLGRTPLAGDYEVRLPRSRFADLPRTEWRFYAAGAKADDPAALLVFFQGVPDTTPEFNDAMRLREDLALRAARARGAAGGRR